VEKLRREERNPGTAWKNAEAETLAVQVSAAQVIVDVAIMLTGLSVPDTWCFRRNLLLFALLSCSGHF